MTDPINHKPKKFEAHPVRFHLPEPQLTSSAQNFVTYDTPSFSRIICARDCLLRQK